MKSYQRIVVDAGLTYETTALALGMTVEDTLDLISEDNRILREIEEDYRTNEIPRVKQQVKEMVEEFIKEDRDDMRRAYLETAIPEAKQEFLEACMAYAALPDKSLEVHLEQNLIRLERRLFKLGMDAKILVGKKEGITPEQIAQACQYPIKELIKNRAGMANCPFHDDKTASMDIRKNFYFCYGCGEHGNVIDLVRKLEGLTFPEAIKRLI